VNFRRKFSTGSQFRGFSTDCPFSTIPPKNLGGAQRKNFVSAITTLLRSELDRFADKHELTAREYDVVFLLLSGLSTVAQIAERLGLSQNTVHNHFKNVFRRTSTNSKAGLLSMFLKDAFGRQVGLQPFIKRPSVLVIEPDVKARTAIRDALVARNMRVEEETDSRRAVQRIAELRTDVVIADLSLPGSGNESLLTEIVNRYGKNPIVLLTTTDGSTSRREWMDKGAAGVFAKPVSVDRLVFAILENFVDTPYDRSRLVRVDVEVPAKIDDRVDVHLGNIGFGGAFVPLPHEQMGRDAFLVGQRVRVTFTLDDGESINTMSEIMWRRPSSRPSMPAGIGIRFLNLNDSNRSAVEEFVRKKKLMGFMPWNEPQPEPRHSRRPTA
jgi:DNA-binding NarL/FixJ family response regulator